MKDLICRTLTLSVLIASAGLAVSAENNPPGYVDFGTLPAPSSGGEFVEVNVKNNLISMMARLAEKNEPEVADLLRHLQMVRVNVIGLDDGNRAEIEKRVKKIRSDLDQAEQVTLAVPAAADQAHPFLHVAEFGGVVGKSGQCERGGCAGLEEFSAVHEILLDTIGGKHKS